MTTAKGHSDPAEVISAISAYEFLDGGVDYDTIEQIHRGELEEWVTALTRSEVFDEEAVAAAAASWRENPRLLLDALLLKADEVTKRRCRITWAALDRLAPLARLG